MRILLLFILLCFAQQNYAQTVRVEATISAKDLPDNMGKVLFFSLPDSTLVKGSYLENDTLSTTINAKLNDSLYATISAPGFMDSTIRFQVVGDLVQLGQITLIQDLTLDEVQVTYSKPVFERTMDGISVNVKGTTLEQLNTLFDILKASPRLASPDEESIEIVGVGSPLILIDRQPIISNDELKAIPADQVERIEIITSPSAKYRAQGSGSGVIEVYTNDFKLEGYRATINMNGGVSTQLQPVGRLNLGLSYKKKKFTLNSYLGVNYNSTLRNGITNGISDDALFGFESDYETRRQSMWQYYNVKMAYALKPDHRITLGVNGNGSVSSSTILNTANYHSYDTLTLNKEATTDADYKWLRNTAFINYTWETDTFGSAFEVNLNYLNKVNDNNITNLSDIRDYSNSSLTQYSSRILSNDRPNIGEIRVNYEHKFDTSNWQLDVGGSYSLLVNEKVFDRQGLVNNNWAIDPIYSNSYDYQEDIGAVFAEVSKKWDKIGFRVGVRGEYTKLDGYSKSLQQQFMDSSYFMFFPTASILFEPTDTIGVKIYYRNGIDRPQFTNYDPFVRIQDSLSVEYGNPYLKPSVEHLFGLELDFFQAYNISFWYSFIDKPISHITFVNDSTFVSESTPWNALKEEGIGGSIDLPIELDWLSGWNSLWIDYTRYTFTDLFEREPYFNLTYGLYSYLTFKLPKDFSILNRLSLYKWGSDQMTTKANFNWGIRLTKKFLNGDMRLFVEASNIIPTKNEYHRRSANYTTSSYVQNQFTSFKLGWFYKFGRLKAPTNIQESSSGQSDRL